MTLRKSTPSDIPSIMRLIDDAKVAMKASGLDQWQDGYPNAQVFSTDISRGESYVVTDDETGAIIGTGTLYIGKEPAYEKIYDGCWQSSGTYATIHRVATDAKHKKSGVASFILQSFEKICLTKKIHWIRTDTHNDNIPTRNMLAKSGYAYSGIIYYGPQGRRLAFEKQLPQNPQA